MNDITASQVISIRAIGLDAPGRGGDLQVRVSAPMTGTRLPVLIFSHGYGAFGASMDTYQPLVDHWTSHGFVVVQPNHLDAQGLAPEDPRTPHLWRTRIHDVARVIDNLDHLEAEVPGLAGRTDHDRLAVGGHSFGATTASALVGARVIDANAGGTESFADSRVKAAVLLALTGTGGDDLSPFAKENFPFMNPDFGDLATPSMVIAGDADDSPLTRRGPDWFTDAFTLASGVTDLLTLHGAEHSLGGVTGYHDTHTTDENPAQVALIRDATTAYLRSALGVDASSWPRFRDELTSRRSDLGQLESKPSTATSYDTDLV